MYILDRFEEGKAVIEYTDENGKATLFSEEDISRISPDVKEGDILYLKDDIYYTDEVATTERRKEAAQRLKELTKCVKRPL